MQTIQLFRPGQPVIFDGLTYLIVSIRAGCAALTSRLHGSAIARLSDLEPFGDAA
jgi:hypothetical protein